jgi:hypothetical protein
MPADSPDDLDWLARLLDRSPLGLDATVRGHWRRLLPWLSADARYELAAILRELERAVDEDAA